MKNQEIKFHKAKKSLGQNFLKSKMVLRKIIEVSEVKEENQVLEIGPGKGALTEFLLSTYASVVAVEKDTGLVTLLREKFAEEIKNKKLILLEEDILEFDTKYCKKNYKIIANIPYNITGAILKKFLTAENQPESMTLLVQKEVAQRIVANNKKESLLSISVKAYGEPKMIMKVPAEYFSPAPKVDSAVIYIKNISRKKFEKNNINEENFWNILHHAFAHKRKKLSGNLKNIVNKDILEKYKDKRAEDLSLADWLILTK